MSDLTHLLFSATRPVISNVCISDTSIKFLVVSPHATYTRVRLDIQVLQKFNTTKSTFYTVKEHGYVVKISHSKIDPNISSLNACGVVVPSIVLLPTVLLMKYCGGHFYSVPHLQIGKKLESLICKTIRMTATTGYIYEDFKETNIVVSPETGDYVLCDHEGLIILPLFCNRMDNFILSTYCILDTSASCGVGIEPYLIYQTTLLSMFIIVLKEHLKVDITDFLHDSKSTNIIRVKCCSNLIGYKETASMAKVICSNILGRYPTKTIQTYANFIKTGFFSIAAMDLISYKRSIRNIVYASCPD